MGNDFEGVSIQAPIQRQFHVPGGYAGPLRRRRHNRQRLDHHHRPNAIGLQITPTGGVGGNMRITGFRPPGPGAQAVQLNGTVGGYVNISSGITATGYRTTTRQTNPFIAALYSQMEMQQGGAAVTVGGDIGAGLIVSAPPPIPSTTNLDQDNDGVPDAVQGTGSRRPLAPRRPSRSALSRSGTSDYARRLHRQQLHQPVQFQPLPAQAVRPGEPGHDRRRGPVRSAHLALSAGAGCRRPPCRSAARS